MPNWCFNALSLISEKKYLREFNCNNTDSSGDIDFGRSVPFPSDRDEDEEWYHWRIENWGTKWTAYDTIMTPIFTGENDKEDEKESELIYEFCTAWSPPIAWLNKVSTMCPNIKFELKYHEPGVNFSGIFEIHAGDIIKDVDGKYGEYFGDIYFESDSDNDNNTN